MSRDNALKLGLAADRIDNLLAAMELPLPPDQVTHALKSSMTDVRDDLREVYVSETDKNPWEEC